MTGGGLQPTRVLVVASRPPLFTGYAVRIGVRRQTLWNWARQHEEFGQAVGVCKAMQEHVFITMGLLGAYRPGMAKFVLKNLFRWHDKVEQANHGVVLRVVEQDKQYRAA